MAQKLQSQTSKFMVQNVGSPNPFVIVGGVTSIRDMRSGTAAEIDVTDLLSTAKEFVLGLADNGTMGIDLLYDPLDPGQIILERLRDTSARSFFRVQIPRGSLAIGSPNQVSFTFQGFVQTFPFTAAVDAAITGTVSVRVTGNFTKV
jgi:hypothetical protein